MDTSQQDHYEEEKSLNYVNGEELVENIEIVLEEFRVLVTEISNIKVSEKSVKTIKDKNNQCKRSFLKLTRLLSELQSFGSLEDTLYEYEIVKDKEFKNYETTLANKEKEIEEHDLRTNSWTRKILGNSYLRSFGTVVVLGTIGGIVGGPVGGVVALSTGYGSLIGGAVGGVVGVGIGGAVGVSSVSGTKAIQKVKKVHNTRKTKKMLEIDITNDIDELTTPPLIFMSQEKEKKDSTIQINNKNSEILELSSTFVEEPKSSGGGLFSFLGWGGSSQPEKKSEGGQVISSSEEETDEEGDVDITVNSTRISVLDSKYEETEGEGEGEEEEIKDEKDTENSQDPGNTTEPKKSEILEIEEPKIEKIEISSSSSSSSSSSDGGGGILSFLFGGKKEEVKEKKIE